jgi:hypothetical protein
MMLNISVSLSLSSIATFADIVAGIQDEGLAVQS